MDKQSTFDGYTNFVGGLSRASNTYSNQVSYNFISKTRSVLEYIYRTSWIAAKVIDSLAEDMTKDGIHITGLDPTQTSELQKYMTHLNIWQSLTDLIKWSRLYGGAIGVIMINGQDMSTPLDLTTIAQNQFLGISVFDRYRVDPYTQDVNPIDNEPNYYSLENNQGIVHRSRIIKMIGVKLPYLQYQQNMYWGDSVIERIFRSIKLREEALDNISKLINKAWVRTVKIDNLRQAIAAGGKIQENIINAFTLMAQVQNSTGLTLLDNKDTFQTDSYSFSGLNDLISSFDQDVAGASDIPMTRLYGQSPAGFSNGESDLKTYYDKVSTTQENMLREPITKLLNISYSSLFGTPYPEDTLDFDFNSAWRPNEIDDRNTTINELRLILDAANNGIIGTDKALINLREVGKKYGLFSSITDEDISLNAPIPEPPSADDVLNDAAVSDDQIDAQLEAELNSSAAEVEAENPQI